MWLDNERTIDQPFCVPSAVWWEDGVDEKVRVVGGVGVKAVERL